MDAALECEDDRGHAEGELPPRRCTEIGGDERGTGREKQPGGRERCAADETRERCGQEEATRELGGGDHHERRKNAGRQRQHRTEPTGGEVANAHDP